MKPHLFCRCGFIYNRVMVIGENKDFQGKRNGVKTNGWITIVGEGHTDYCACFQYAKWNVEVIAGYEKPNGFIVQLFSRKSCPPNTILPDVKYYEAWLVKDGITIDSLDQGYDDLFAIANPMYPLEVFSKSIYTYGEYRFEGKIFWIDKGKDSTIYKIVKDWPTDEVPQAGGLRAVYHSDIFDEMVADFIRIPFIHSWDLTTAQKVYEVAKQAVFKMCPNPQCKRDRDIFNSVASEVFPDPYKEMRERLWVEWNKQV